MTNAQPAIEPMPPVVTPRPKTLQFLNFADAAAHMRTMGLPVSERQVRRMAEEKRLPFFKGPTGRRIISIDALERRLLELQNEAVNDGERHRAGRRPRRAQRSPL